MSTAIPISLISRMKTILAWQPLGFSTLALRRSVSSSKMP
jgi:hypothetical protein